jgi:hypothetical protein
MIANMETCPITGLSVTVQMDQHGTTFFYETPNTGRIAFTDMAFRQASQLTSLQKMILQGICRNRQLLGQEPQVFNAAFLNQLENQPVPYAFEEKARHFLQYLYDNGGKTYKEHHLTSSNAAPIVYASAEEFDRIMRYVREEGWVACGSITPTQQGTAYQSVHLTKSGIQEIEKGLPKIPMYGLVNQQITTGDAVTDAAIEHARALFFNLPATLEAKRSACENLSYLLEPLRQELKTMFTGDTETFFHVVNDFSVRHNKERTKRMEYPEQLEWVFYSLLNTLNTYVKMKKKLI